MKVVTKIEVQKNNKERVNIYIDGKYSFAVYADVAINKGIKKGMIIDDEIINNINSQEKLKKCKYDAIKIVERSYKSVKQVEDKLLKKEYSEAEIKYAINFLKEYNFIDDKKYTKAFVHDKMAKNGENKIRYELIKKGISKDIINEVLGEINKDDILQNAIDIGTKKYNVIIKKENDKYKIKNKLCVFLAGRGYDFDTAKKAINMIISNI